MITPNSSLAFFIWGLGACFFFLEYIVRVSPGVIVNDLISSFHINAYQIGLLSSAFSLSYISMQIPVGALVDRYSVRWLIGSMALLCALATVIFSLTRSFECAIFARFLIGITGAFAFVGALKIATLYFSPQYFGFLAGTTQALGMLGAAVGLGPLSILVAWITWRHALLILALMISILSLFIFLFLRDKAEMLKKAPAQTLQADSFFLGLRIVMKNPHNWVNVMVIGLLYAPTMVFGELWGPLYLAKVYSLSSVEAASVVSVIFIGWALGSPLVGWISDCLGQRKIIILLSALLSFLTMFFMLYAHSLSASTLFVLAFVYGFTNVGVSLCYVVACEINPHQFSGTALGFTNMASIIFGAIFQPLIGRLLDMNWDGLYHEGARVYSAVNLQKTMIALPISLILCLIFACFLRESFHQSKR